MQSSDIHRSYQCILWCTKMQVAELRSRVYSVKRTFTCARISWQLGTAIVNCCGPFCEPLSAESLWQVFTAVLLMCAVDTSKPVLLFTRLPSSLTLHIRNNVLYCKLVFLIKSLLLISWHQIQSVLYILTCIASSSTRCRLLLQIAMSVCVSALVTSPAAETVRMLTWGGADSGFPKKPLETRVHMRTTWWVRLNDTSCCSTLCRINV